jgi:hypothetical protein
VLVIGSAASALIGQQPSSSTAGLRDLRGAGKELTMVSDRDERDALAVVARYGQLIDDRNWNALTAVFTEDVVVEWINENGSTTATLPELAALWANYNHPSGHHSTNAICEAAEDGNLRVRSKGLAVESDGRAWSVAYDDILVRTEQGWRIRKRVVRERPSIARETRQLTRSEESLHGRTTP